MTPSKYFCLNVVSFLTSAFLKKKKKLTADECHRYLLRVLPEKTIEGEMSFVDTVL